MSDNLPANGEPAPDDGRSDGAPTDGAPLPEQMNSLDISTTLILALAGILILIALFQGRETALAGFRASWSTAVDLVPLLLGVFIIVGFADQLLPKELIAEWLGGESGLRGILIASVIGILTPGGPFVSYPLVATLYRAGAGIGPLVAFVTAWALGSISRLPLEIGIVGVRLTAIRLASSIIFPPFAGFIASAITRFIKV
ncbi:MAG: permease [Candidatus Promineifilaceae bacterium]|nr:permease [Candidatus Promineifilaceae bacterium]